MANEAIIVELLGNAGDPIEFTVAEGTDKPKLSIMKLLDTRNATLSSADGDNFAGIAAMEKIGGDGSTTMSCYTHGIFDLVDSGAGITFGDKVTIGGVNKIKTAAAGEAETGQILGVALETIAAGGRGQILIGGW